MLTRLNRTHPCKARGRSHPAPAPSAPAAGAPPHRYFQQWAEDGVFEDLWARCLEEYDELKGIDWQWQALDSLTVPSPVKKGTQRGIIRPIEANSAPNGTS